MIHFITAHPFASVAISFVAGMACTFLYLLFSAVRAEARDW